MPGITVQRAIFKGAAETNIEQFSCVGCKLLLKDPVQPACGHRLCKSCADELIEEQTTPRCPECKEVFDEEDGAKYFPDRFVKREISNMEVICVFSDAGCNWEGKFSEFDKHISKCDFATSCCEYCNESIRRDKLDLHLRRLCPCIPKQCPLAGFGCKDSRMTKKNLEKHMEESQLEHMSQLVVRLRSIEEKMKLQEMYETQQSKTRGVNHPVWDEVEVDGPRSFDNHCDSGLGQSLGSMNTPRSKTHFVARLQDVESSLSNSVTGIDMAMRTKFQSMLTAQVASLTEEVKRNFTLELRGKDEELQTLKTTVAKLEKQIRSKNAELEDRDFRLSLIENSNHDGSMIWKIPQFSQRKGDAENGKYTSIFSLPFYSGRYGYKMCLRLYIMGDGIGKGTHLSLFFVVMRGEFDNILQWPFTHKVTFKLLNQAGGRDIVDTFQPDPMSSSFRKPKSDMNIASGCPRFVSHTELERGGFIVDDTIFIKCSIDTSTIRHP